jgi:hypothetical protein
MGSDSDRRVATQKGSSTCSVRTISQNRNIREAPGLDQILDRHVNLVIRSIIIGIDDQTPHY